MLFYPALLHSLRSLIRDVLDIVSNHDPPKGRATVKFVLKKGGGEKFDIDGMLYDKAALSMVVDGYNAPLTGGNFVDLINKGFYNNMKIQRSDGFVVQTGDPDGPADG